MFSSKGGVSASQLTGISGHLLGVPGPSGFGASSTAEQVAANWDGKGKTVLITGANTGLGQESARVLAARGADVVIAVRDTAKGAAVAEKIKAQHPGAAVSVLPLDLTSLASVEACARQFEGTGKPLHILMLNAGVMMCPFSLTKDGHEMQFGTNHLGHFALTHHLKDAMVATAKDCGHPGRVVSLASCAHWGTYPNEPLLPEDRIDGKEGYNQMYAYGQSKLCNVLFAREANRRWQEEGVPLVAVSCHPGVIPSSELFRHIAVPWFLDRPLRLALGPFFKSLGQGAATQTYLATSDEALKNGGEYFADCNLNPSSPAAHDMKLAERLWAMSERMCGFSS